MCIIELKSCKYSDIKTRLLSKIDRDQKDDISLEDPVDESHRTLSLKEHTTFIDHRNGITHTRRFH